MSKPDFASLGVSAELTLHEKALREAQNEITALKAECARLREQVRQAYAPQTARVDDGPLTGTAFNEFMASIRAATTPPHHSTVGLGMDGEGRVQG